MPIHFYNLLLRSFFAVPGALGSTWLGLFFPLWGFLLTQLVILFADGWPKMRTHWRQNIVRGLAVAGAAWGSLFLWCVITTTYADHTGLAIRVATLHKTVDADAQHEQNTVAGVRQVLGGQLSALQQSCAELKGANGVLTKQAADQQGTINNCQTQAINLLKPVPFQWRAVALEEADRSSTSMKQRWILLANKDISPAEFIFTCSRPIVSAEAKIAGSSADARTVRIDQDHWGTQIRSPAWGPNSPALIITTLAATSDADTSCSFKLETVVK